MSREIIFYAEKNRNPETRIELYWTGADSAQLLFEALTDLSYENNANYVKVDKAEREIKIAIEDKIKETTNKIKEYESVLEDRYHALSGVSSLEVYHEVLGDVNYYKEEIKELQESIDCYQNIKQTLITIFSLEFLQTSDWELYILYSY